jgi:hypothetical protein
MKRSVSLPPSMFSWHVGGQFYLYLVYLPQNTTYQVNILYHDECFLSVKRSLVPVTRTGEPLIIIISSSIFNT